MVEPCQGCKKNPEWKPRDECDYGYGWCFDCLNNWKFDFCMRCHLPFTERQGRCEAYAPAPVCAVCTDKDHFYPDATVLAELMEKHA